MPRYTGDESKVSLDDRFKIIESLYRPSFSDGMYDLTYDLKLHYRLFKKAIRKYIRRKTDKNFVNIVYFTADCPMYVPNSERLDSPTEFISAIRNQYPDTNICLLIPLIGLSESTKISKKITVDFDNKFYNLERTSVNFDFFAQNSTWECSLYKFSKNESNITIYGIYSPAFSYVKSPEAFKLFEKRVLLLRAARGVIRSLHKDGFKPAIVHSEYLPFFMGAEFETKFPADIRVFQVFDNFAKPEIKPQEAFWSIINIANKEGIKRLCKDVGIQSCFARLFNFPVKMIAPKMQYFISLVLDNYNIFKSTSGDDSEGKGTAIFKQLNDRTKKIFSNIIRKEDGLYYPLNNTILDSDFWAVYSETYYGDLYSKKLASAPIMREISRTSDKSGYIGAAIDIDKYNYRLNFKIYNDFDKNNYKEERIKNKKIIIKEFGSDSIKTNFIDKTIFKNSQDVKIYGYLDSFYDSPLLFANPEPEVYTEGADILLNTILKLFERNRNIQIIVSIKDGLKQDYVKSVVDFLNGNRIFMGRWVFVDGEVNLPKLFSASDMYLYSPRICGKSLKHLIGMHYGCIPVVSNAGMLKDTVVDIFDNILDGNGFKTKESLLYEDESTDVYVNCLEKALDLYNNNPSSWNLIMKNAFSTNSGWDFSKLEHYNQIYNNI